MKSRILTNKVRWSHQRIFAACVVVAGAIASALGWWILYCKPVDIVEIAHATTGTIEGRVSSRLEDRALIPVIKPPRPIEAGTGTSTPEIFLQRDFGSKILHAAGPGSADDAMVAARLIFVCRDVDKNLEIIFKMKSENTVKKLDSGYLTVIKITQVEQRACQTVTPDLLNLRAQLLLKAMDGNVVGAAAQYIGETLLHGGINPAKKQSVLASLRSDAESGDKPSLFFLTVKGRDYSLSDLDFHAYQLAYKTITSFRANAIDMSLAEHAEKIAADLPLLDSNLEEQMKLKARSMVKAYERRRDAAS